MRGEPKPTSSPTEKGLAEKKSPGGKKQKESD
jgi:hypothetical protein